MASSASDLLSPPLIGLSTYVETARHGVWEEVAALLPVNYVTAVTRAGGCPLLLPPAPLDPRPVLSILDGLVITGGPDVDPRRYGAAPHQQTDPPREERDAWEITLCLGALDIGLPLLAICRGLQVLNVSRGGTLHQHLPDVVGHDTHRPTLGHASPNRITIDQTTAVGSILGAETEGRCHHHQALDRLGEGVQVVARAADGAVEAVELPEKEFVIGVQWHPEDNPGDDRLFAALVEAAARRRVTGHDDGDRRVERPVHR